MTGCTRIIFLQEHFDLSVPALVVHEQASRRIIWQNCSFYGEMIPCSNRASVKLPPDAWSILSGPLEANKGLNVLEKAKVVIGKWSVGGIQGSDSHSEWSHLNLVEVPPCPPLNKA